MSVNQVTEEDNLCEDCGAGIRKGDDFCEGCTLGARETDTQDDYEFDNFNQNDPEN